MRFAFGKKHLVAAALTLFALPLFTVPRAEAAPGDKVFKLSFADHDPATSSNSRDMQAWCDRIKEVTNGRVDIALYPGSTIASVPEELDAVKTGAADIAWIFSSLYPGQFPITEAMMLPLVGLKTPQQAASVMWDLYQESEAMRNELDSRFKVLMMYTNPINRIVTRAKPVNTVADLKGLKLRAPAGTATDMITAWGGVPILMGPGDMYSALDKGVLDGFVLEYSGIKSFKLYEVSKHYTAIDFFAGPFLILMNKDTWNSLPPDLQAAIDKESGRATSIRFAENFQKDAMAGLELIKANGGSVITLKDETLEGFKAAAKDYAQKWIGKHQSAKFDAKAYFNRMIELLEKYKDL